MSSNQRITILQKNRIFDQFFKIDEVQYQQETYQGTLVGPLTRLVLDRGDSVAAVVHQQDTGTLYFAEQLRVPTLEKGPGWLIELPAGVVEPNELPEKTILREIEEEIGYKPHSAELIGTFYLSPGGSSERIFLYYCPVKNQDHVSNGGGLIEEGESIRLVHMPVTEAFVRLKAGLFTDAKTIIGLQWLQMRENSSQT